MIVAIHQPNFAPWLGFFDKMVQADAFVLLDTVPYTKGGYQNRAQVKGPDGPQWLTVPVITKGRLGQSTREVEINEAPRWRHAHLQTLRTVLGKAPHRRVLLDRIEPIYEAAGVGNLVDFNLALIRELVAALGISTRLVMAADLACRGRGTQLLLDLVKAVGGDVYLSGPSGRAYLEPELFERDGVRLEYHEFRERPYPQLFGDFVPRLSCLDYLANVGFTPWRNATA